MISTFVVITYCLQFFINFILNIRYDGNPCLGLKTECGMTSLILKDLVSSPLEDQVCLCYSSRRYKWFISYLSLSPSPTPYLNSAAHECKVKPTHLISPNPWIKFSRTSVYVRSSRNEQTPCLQQHLPMEAQIPQISKSI